VIDRAVAAIVRGEVVVLPTDTVYGLAATADRPEGRDVLYALKGREETQPTAIVAGSIELLLGRIPELRGRSEAIVRALLPGPFTLVLPNPARRFPWLCGTSPDAIGVRVPAVGGAGGEVLTRVGAVVATERRRSSTEASFQVFPRRSSTSPVPSCRCSARVPATSRRR
jgi:L-threonylcarbamoyladenylate synthase